MVAGDSGPDSAAKDNVIPGAVRAEQDKNAIQMTVAFQRLEPFTLVAAFIFATPQATGPHHAFMVYPFNHMLVAVALSKCVG